MDPALGRHFRDLGRGMIGALIFAAPFLYTMETWWLGWRLPGEYLLVYAFVGLALVTLVVRAAGMREEDVKRRTPVRHVVEDTLELVLESFLAAFVVLAMFGILERGDPMVVLARVGLIQVVPLALGAALANRTLGAESDNHGALEAPFPRDVAVFAMGALFVSLPIVPTEEMERIATHASWWHLMSVMLVSLILAYLILFELEFKGQPGRVSGLTAPLQVGETVLVYGVALSVSTVLLAIFGHFHGGATFSLWVQETVVLGFLATIGGSAARVIF